MKKHELGMRPEEKALLILLRASLCEKSRRLSDISVSRKLLDLAEEHACLPLLFDPVQRLTKGQGDLYKRVKLSASQAALQSYHLLYLSCQICTVLEREGISAAVLKGAAAASFYPVPEYRKSGDVDILLCDPDSKEEAVRALEKAGYRVDSYQPALHQIVMREKTGVEVELHVMLAEPFDNRKINDYMDALLPDIRKHIVKKKTLGVELPVLDQDYQAFELLLHMLQHFLRRGFGLKLLCDWVAYWNSTGKEGETSVQRYRELIRDCGITGFSDMITAVCCRYLGLKKSCLEVLISPEGKKITGRKAGEAFLREVFNGGEFGDREKDRMVMLRGEGLDAYVREFHHQMLLNFPRAGQIPLLWPGLWGATLGRFLYNNVHIRHISGFQILKKSGERSRILKQIRLWKR